MVNKQGLIFIPLIFMFTISMFSLAGLEESEALGEGYIYGQFTQYDYFYDYTGRPLIYTANFTHVSERGSLQVYVTDLGEGTKGYAMWQNTTGLFVVSYYIYATPAGNSTGLYPVLHNDMVNYRQNIVQNSLINVIGDFNSSYGLIALFISLMVGIGLAGIHFFGIGEAETSLQTIFMGAGLIAVWVVFSIISLNLLATIPLGIGSIFYFGLTLSYVVGLMLNIGK